MLWAIGIASALLLLGLALRVSIRPLQWLFLPASVVGGIVGLVLVQGARAIAAPEGPEAGGAVYDFVEQLAATFGSWPGTLIAVVFACLLLERPGARRMAEASKGALLQGLTVWGIITGHIVLGLAATLLVIQPAYPEVPNAFGQLIEAGFPGGHGTAAALGGVFDEQLGFPEGEDLGFVMATIGLLFSVVVGIALVNIAVRSGMTRAGRVEVRLSSGMARQGGAPLGLARVRPEVLDPLVLPICLVGIAFLLGMLLQQGVALGAAELEAAVNAGRAEEDQLRIARWFGNLPLFLFTLLGGWGVRAAVMTLGLGDLLDAGSIQRIVGVAMDFLIVAAIASLRIEVVGTYLWPILLLAGLGLAWSILCLLVVSRWTLPRGHWFELGIINFGMSTGTTAQGMMLLRIVDEDLESGAAEDYALGAPLSAPFIGGGFITVLLPLVLEQTGIPIVLAVVAVVCGGTLTAAALLRRAGGGPRGGGELSGPAAASAGAESA